MTRLDAWHTRWHAARALHTRCGTQHARCACGVFDSYETQLRTVSSVCRGSVACHVGGRRCRIPWIEDLFVHMCVLRVTVRVVRVETDVLVESAAYSIKITHTL